MILSLKRSFQKFDLISAISKFLHIRIYPHPCRASWPACMANLHGVCISSPLSGVRVSQRPPFFCAYSLELIRIRMHPNASDVWQICMAGRMKKKSPRGELRNRGSKWGNARRKPWSGRKAARQLAWIAQVRLRHLRKPTRLLHARAFRRRAGVVCADRSV